MEKKKVQEVVDTIDLTVSPVSTNSNTDRDAKFAADLSSSSSSSSSSPSSFPESDQFKSLLKHIPAINETTPAIILLDSLGCHKEDEVLPLIRSYIIREWRYRKNGGQPLGGTDTILSLSERNKLFDKVIPTSSPSCQVQDNGSDCGLFALKFVESLVRFSTSTQSPERMQIYLKIITRGYLQSLRFSTIIKSWFTVEDVYHLRATMKTVCLSCKGNDETGSGESNLQKLSFPRMHLDDDGATIFLGCQLLALDTLSKEHQNVVNKKKKEFEDALKDVSRFDDKQLNKNLSMPISVDNSDSDVEEVLDNKQQQQQKRDNDKKKIKNKNGSEEYREDSASSHKRKRNNAEEQGVIDATEDSWDAVKADASSHKDHSSRSVPSLPPPPPPPPSL